MPLFAAAELEKITVNGELRIRGNAYSHPRAPGVFTPDSPGHDASFIEQRTRLGVAADFSNDISAHIGFDDYAIAGEDFRSDYLTGADARAATTDDIEIYEAYLRLDSLWRVPIALKLGRQELRLGSEWLIGNNDTDAFFRGLSFDGIRAQWGRQNFSLDAGWFHLAENSPIEEDSDIDLYFAQAAYTGLRDTTIEAYWIFLRDGRGSRLGFPYDTPNSPDPEMPTLIVGKVSDSIEDFFGVDRYDDTTSIHTFGIRAAGRIGRFDFEAEFAYQRLDAVNITKLFFSPDPATTLTGNSFVPFGGPYGDDNAQFDFLAFNAEFGYTIDIPWQPRPFIGAAYFEGSDKRDDNLGAFIRNWIPFYQHDTSAAFNRLFSDWNYSDFLDDSDLSNVVIARAGADFQPATALHAGIEAVWFETDERTHTNGLFIFPFYAFAHSDELGWEIRTRLEYAYSDDLTFQAGYSHFFAAEGIKEGNFFRGNGLLFGGGTGERDTDYFFIESTLRF